MQDARNNETRTSRQAQELIAYWNKLVEAEGGIPPRAAFDPIAIPSVLPSVFLIERLDEDTYRFRLQGTDYVERSFSDLTGAVIERDKAAEIGSPIFSVLDRVLGTPCGLQLTGVEQNEQGRQLLVDYVALPLTDDAGIPRFVMGCGSPLTTVGYDDGDALHIPLVEVRDLREIPISISKEGAA